MSEPANRSFAVCVDEDDIGKRLDTLVTSAFPELSRSSASRLIRDGKITISGAKKKPAYRVNDGDIVEGTIINLQTAELQPEPGDIDIIFEDDHFLVVNKKPGIVVHPSPGHDHGTLVHRLLYLRPQIKGIGGTLNRPGIVHRLDKDTSGIMIVAKTELSYNSLVSQFKVRSVIKRYLGIVYGAPERDAGQIVLKIGRHTRHRKKMTVSEHETARFAETHWKIRETHGHLTLMEFNIKTGRTHQIRVHSASIRHPIVGDMAYGFKKPDKMFKGTPTLRKIIREVPRQMLHAWQLRINHPETGKTLEFEAPLPEDMRSLLKEVQRVMP